MAIEVRVPPVGESITEGVLVEWLKQTGDLVVLDEPLFTLETDKVTITINAAAAGRLTTAVEAGSSVKIGQVVGSIDPQVEQMLSPARPDAPWASSVVRVRAAPPEPPSPLPEPPPPGPPISTPAGLPQVEAKLTLGQPLSPGARKVLDELGGQTENNAQASVRGPAGGDGGSIARSWPVEPGRAAEPRQTRQTLSPLRQRIAERMVQASHDAAMVTTFNEVDMTNLTALRSQHRTAFRDKHGVDLGLMSFFVKAVVDALKAVPELNSQLEGDQLVSNHYYDIGVAVSSDRGLVVPVLRGADQCSLAEIEQQISVLARKVRDRTVTLAELSGGVFSISNGGVFGSLLSTPLLNPPQAGILGMHAIKKRPMVIDDQIAIRPMMYLALSYDHRIVDGHEAVTFLMRIVSYLESPGFTLLGI